MVSIIRSYQPGDEVSILHLFSVVFQQELSLDAWRWKYLRAASPPPIFVVEENGHILCHYGALRQRLWWRGEVVPAWDIVDVMCHPRFQGQGLFRRAAKAFIADLYTQKGLLIYGFPGERHRRLGELLIGYEPICPVYRVRKQLRTQVPPFPAGVVVLQTLPPDWDDQWSRMSKRFDMVAIRDQQMLTWRYLARPGKRYRLLTIPSMAALAVIGIEANRAYLMEFLLEEGNHAAASLLLHGVEAVCRAEGVEEIEGWFARFAWETTFLTSRGGFDGAVSDIYFECRVLDQRIRSTWLRDHFYYSLGDYDVF